MSRELIEQIKAMNQKMLDITFWLSFQRSLPKETQQELKEVEKFLNDDWDRLCKIDKKN